MCDSILSLLQHLPLSRSSIFLLTHLSILHLLSLVSLLHFLSHAFPAIKPLFCSIYQTGILIFPPFFHFGIHFGIGGIIFGFFGCNFHIFVVWFSIFLIFFKNLNFGTNFCVRDFRWILGWNCRSWWILGWICQFLFEFNAF